MKILLPLLLTISLSATQVFAADSVNSKIIFKPIGFRPNNQMLEGGFGSDISLIYKTPCVNITAPSGKLNLIPLPWTSLLNSGISSLLFEHKNYPEYNELSSYTLFANGNYSVINQKILSIANKFLFSNKIILNEIYNWALPYYQETFSLLSTEEQQELFKQLEIAEKYISMRIKHQSIDNYKKWLKENKMAEDEKIIGFLKRRCIKKQWSLNDCQYWLTKIRRDFSPLMKNSHDVASHYQLIEVVLPNLLIVCNHQGNFYLTDAEYHLLDTSSYRLIVRKDNRIEAYRTNKVNDFRIYHLQYYKDFGKLEKFPFSHWNKYSPINDSLWEFHTTHYSGIYDHKNIKTITDSCTSLSFFEGADIFIADRVFTVTSDSSYNVYGMKEIGQELINTGDLIYNLNGKKISNLIVSFIPYEVFNEDGESVSQRKVHYFYTTNDYRHFIFRDINEQVGVIDKSGKVIIPFQFKQIEVSEDQTIFLATDEYGKISRFATGN